MGALKYYLSLTSYLRSYIYFYTQLASLLQALKTSLLKGAPKSGQKRQAYISNIKLKPPLDKELATFEVL